MVLEINAAPDRLDLDDIYVKEAMDAGCLLAVAQTRTTTAISTSWSTASI